MTYIPSPATGEGQGRGENALQQSLILPRGLPPSQPWRDGVGAGASWPRSPRLRRQSSPSLTRPLPPQWRRSSIISAYSMAYNATLYLPLCCSSRHGDLTSLLRRLPHRINQVVQVHRRLEGGIARGDIARADRPGKARIQLANIVRRTLRHIL